MKKDITKKSTVDDSKSKVCDVCGAEIKSEDYNSNVRLLGHICKKCYNVASESFESYSNSMRNKEIEMMRNEGILDMFYEGLDKLRSLGILLPNLYFHSDTQSNGKIRLTGYGDMTVRRRMAGLRFDILPDDACNDYKMSFCVAYKCRAGKDVKGIAIISDTNGKLRKSKWYTLGNTDDSCPKVLLTWLKTVQTDSIIYIDEDIWDRYIPDYDWI